MDTLNATAFQADLFGTPPSAPLALGRQRLRQGQSDATEYKERGLEAAFSINLGIFRGQFGASPYRYWHFDLNCGSGYNEEVGCIGSPLAFLRATEARQVDRYFAAFCDISEDALAGLMARGEIADNPRCHLFHGRNASLVEAIPDIIAEAGENPRLAMGMVLSDPNGFEVPIDELAELARRCPRLDLAIHWNSRIYQLERGRGDAYLDIEDAIARLGKRHWLIRRQMGSHRWTVLIGRNIAVGEHPQLGFHHLASPFGQELLSKCKVAIERDPPPQWEIAL